MSVRADLAAARREYYYGKDASDEKSNKLVLNVMDKKKYVLHISALKFYLQHGLSLRKVHRAISFKQANFLKPFIEFNTEKRKNAKNDFEKDLFKLMNNSVYGKTVENVRKHGDYEIVNTPERFQKLVNKPLFKHRYIINEDLVIVEKDKHTVELNKPIYMGMSILDFSKTHMYSFYYDVLKPKYDDKIKLVYTDTDSYVIKVETDDLYEDFKEINEYMDFSDYNVEHPNDDKTNKKVLGKFKDEMNGKIITHFIGLKPKAYCYKVYGDDKEHKKSKGVVKHKVSNQLSYKTYEETLNRNCKEEVSFNTIRSKNHQIYSINQTKYALSNYDNKRYWYSDFERLPFLFKNTHAKTKSNSKREKVNILKMIRAILTDVLLVGLEWNITMPQESITLRRNERTPNIQIENIENYKQKDKQHHENKTTKYKNTRKNKD